MLKREEDKIRKIFYPNQQKKEQLGLIQYYQNPKFKNRMNIESQKKNIIIRNMNHFKYYYFLFILSGILINTNEGICQYKQCLTCPPGMTYEPCTNCKIGGFFVGYYEIENDEGNIGKYINCYKNPEGYYLDKDASLYKKCYYKCATCDIKGDEENHNCLSCNNNFSTTFSRPFRHAINKG